MPKYLIPLNEVCIDNAYVKERLSSVWLRLCLLDCIDFCCDDLTQKDQKIMAFVLHEIDQLIVSINRALEEKQSLQIKKNFQKNNI